MKYSETISRSHKYLARSPRSSPIDLCSVSNAAILLSGDEELPGHRKHVL